MKAKSGPKKSYEADVRLTFSEIHQLISVAGSKDDSYLCSARKKLQHAQKQNHTTDVSEVPMFSLEDAAVSLSPVEDIPSERSQYLQPKLQTSMLGKRTSGFQQSKEQYMKKVKSQNPCKACGKLNHWYKDRPECLWKMEQLKKSRGRSNQIYDNNTGATKLDDEAAPGPADGTHHKPKPSNSLFH